MTQPKQKHSGYERDEHDFYIEPAWCTELLCQYVTFEGAIHDPACGRGTIPDELKRQGYLATGCDIVNRGWPETDPSPGWDYLRDSTDDWHSNICCNPPYRLTEGVVRHALKYTRGKIAMLLRLDFLASQKRHKLFTKHPPSLVLVLSRRPSMPPGWRDVPATGGMNDYCWIVWGQGPGEWTMPPRIEWAL